MTIRILLSASSALIAAGLLTPASAQVAPAPAPATAAPASTAPAPTAAAAPATPAAPAAWSDSIKLGLQLEGGVSFNPQAPKTNWGQLLTDHPNQPTLNQAMVTFSRDIPKDVSDWDVGFHFTGMYGSDARYTHFLGVFNYVTDNRYQLDVVEASVSVHIPVLAGGIDVKAGLYPTPIGFETIDPSTNPFYSHSYIFNFGIPLKHSGVLAVAHATDSIDIYGGIDTGVNTTFGDQAGDNNGTMGGIVGFGVTAMDSKLTIVALTHFGPENPSLGNTQPLGLYNANGYFRYLSDAYATYKWTDKLTSTTEINYIKDTNPLTGGADGYGIAQYFSYTLTDTVALNLRGEVFRDGKGFYVAYYPGNLDFVNVQYGKYNTAQFGPHGTYGEVTFGATWKPDGLPKPISGLLIRPEVRYDSMLGTVPGYKAPFNGGKNAYGVTLASDFVLTF